MNPHTTAVALLAAISGTTDARPRPADSANAAPALARYRDTLVDDALWRREDLSRRDRSLVTVAALAATRNPRPLRHHLGLALDHGVTPLELSELVTHVAFYAGFPAGDDAATELAAVFRDLGIALEPDDAAPIALDADKEAARKRSVATVARVAPGLARFTDEVLFAEVWRRPGLAPRDRSLATVAALIALGQAEQVPFHLSRALDNGLTEAEAAEVVAHLAFICGWPRAFSALGPLGTVLQARNALAPPDAPAELTVTPRADAPHFAGPADTFTGDVEVESLFQADLAGDNGGGMVHFQPGARTAWHTHPRGQTLIVTAGEGWVQQEGKARHTLRVGDVVRIPPDNRHWHGATDVTAMSHIAIAESVDGASVTWMERVPDAAYLAP